MNNKTPFELMIRGFRNGTPTEMPHYIFYQPREDNDISITYGHEQKENGGWWYLRVTEGIQDIPLVQYFGPYPTEIMAIERMEYARRHENLNSGGGLSQNLNAPSERAMINDIFGRIGLGVPQMVPRR